MREKIPKSVAYTKSSTGLCKKKLTQTKERHTNADMIHTEHEQTRLLNKIP